MQLLTSAGVHSSSHFQIKEKEILPKSRRKMEVPKIGAARSHLFYGVQIQRTLECWWSWGPAPPVLRHRSWSSDFLRLIAEVVKVIGKKTETETSSTKENLHLNVKFWNLMHFSIRRCALFPTLRTLRPFSFLFANENGATCCDFIATCAGKRWIVYLGVWPKCLSCAPTSQHYLWCAALG